MSLLTIIYHFSVADNLVQPIADFVTKGTIKG